jgi:hypothetical protein
VLCIAGGAPPLALARPPSAAAVEIAAIGFDGRIRPGAWTPVWIDVTAGASEIDGVVTIEVPARSGEAVVSFGTPVRAAAGATVRVFVPAIFFDARRPGSVHLESRGQRQASLVVPRLRAADEIVVVLSEVPVGVEAAAMQIGRLAVAYVAPETLPPRWQAYESVRLLVVRDLDERRLDDSQRAALRHWLWVGGRVLAMPAADDVRHLHGPTLGPLRVAGSQGGAGRGQWIEWTRDAVDPAVRETPAQIERWRAVLATPPRDWMPALEAAVPSARPVPMRTHVAIGVLVVLYVLAIRRTSRWLASLRPVALVATGLLIAAATAGAVGVAVLVRRDASGVVSATTIEVLHGTGHGVLSVAGRTVSSHGGSFVVSAPQGWLLRSGPTTPVRVVVGDRVEVRGRGNGVPFVGSAVVPTALSGTVEAKDGGLVVRIANRSGHVIEAPWIYRDGQVQRIPPIRESAEIALEEERWQAAERLPRTEENHALLARTFSRLQSDAILKTAPVWLVGWWRDPALALTWDGRAQAPLQLVLVPLAARR